MHASESLRSGDIAGALDELKEQVRRAPQDAQHRIFLFQLYAILGDWQRARLQLDVLTELKPDTMPMVQTYRQVMNCERAREEVFAGRAAPTVFGPPTGWIALLAEALRHDSAGRHAEAQRLRDDAFEQEAATPGTVEDQPFAWLADADPRLGPVLEVIVSGRYLWAPFSRIRYINLERPSDLRDLVWLPAALTWANGGEAAVFVPVRYPGTIAEGADPMLLLARRTDWQERAGAGAVGLGQRLLATDSGDHALLDTRRIALEPTDDGADTAGAP